MGKAKFTKGEWDAVAPSERHIMECGTDITTYEVNCGEIVVCGWVFLDKNGYDLEEAAANAHLIAAAPEMYKEIENDIRILEGFTSLNDGSYEYEEAKKDLDRKRLLLAKARGEL